MNHSKLHFFEEDVSHIDLPKKFTFPFYYEPHKIAIIAAEQVQRYLLSDHDINHDFGLQCRENNEGLGKMFGVLIVRDQKGRLGYLAAYSGKMGSKYQHKYFVPPIVDILEDGGYFNEKSLEISDIINRINNLESDETYLAVRSDYDNKRNEFEKKVLQQKKEIKLNQKERQAERRSAEDLGDLALLYQLRKRHHQESVNDKFLMREYTSYLYSLLAPVESHYERFESRILNLKTEMKAKSIDLQNWLFSQYNFLNINKEIENVIDIFSKKINDIPPSGAGDCAAPRMFQYAFEHEMTPIAMAEFWWGASPDSKAKKHKYYYPSCRGKCEPILGHMLSGLAVDPNPLLDNPAHGKKLIVIYEDDYIIAINKPAEFMSVPGKFVIDSVQERMKARYPDTTGPMIVHRLDMSTSGLMVLAKSKDVHKDLQEQFRSRKVKKRYKALLDGVITSKEGYIDLPLRVDLDNRPFQIVCREHGKSARTKYEVIEVLDGQTLMHYYPITGRTHQLRVHSAHHQGLDAPIVGDDLYGKKGERLCLHAEAIWLTHPVTKEELFLEVECKDF